MAPLGRSVDELEVNLLQGTARCARDKCLAQSNGSLLGSNYATFDHQEIALHASVVGETTHGRNALLGEICIRRAVARVRAAPNAVNLFVHLCSVEVALLTVARHLELNACRVPGSDARNLPQTAVGLPRQASYSKPGDHTLNPVALRDTCERKYSQPPQWGEEIGRLAPGSS